MKKKIGSAFGDANSTPNPLSDTAPKANESIGEKAKAEAVRIPPQEKQLTGREAHFEKHKDKYFLKKGSGK